MRSVITLPDHHLRQKSCAVSSFDHDLHLLVDEMCSAMQVGLGGVGIAAVQIGKMQRVIVIDCSHSKRPCPNHGLLPLINPELIELSEKTYLGREGCLSVPEWVAMVRRSESIQLRFQDTNGAEHTLKSHGFEARVLQHEMDHLDGILFIDRVVSTHDLVRRS